MSDSPANLSPTLRLAVSGGKDQCTRTQKALGKPDIRLAMCGPPEALKKGLTQPPTVRLAHPPGSQSDNNLKGDRGVPRLPETSAPALLISFFYLDGWLKNQADYQYRDWVLDSGAFSAHNSGVTIDLQEYIECAQQLLATDPTLTEVFALDVIGDWRATMRNTEAMWAAGVPAIPTFHGGQPWDVLEGLARDYPKLAIGGVALAKAGFKMEFAKQCFARIWPHRIHGFGFGGRNYVKQLPFHSVDATNWEIGPCRYGQWRSFGGNMSVRGSAQNLRAEVEWYLEVEREARARWRKTMQEVGFNE